MKLSAEMLQETWTLAEQLICLEGEDEPEVLPAEKGIHSGLSANLQNILAAPI